MSEKRIIRRLASDLVMGKTSPARLRNLSDEDIAIAVSGDPDAAPLDLDWSDAEIVIPPAKTAISIRLDADIVDYFKSTGQGYQTRINAVLRRFMERQKQKA